MILQKIFRALNSRLITTDSLMEEKLLKIPFTISTWMYRNFGKNITSKNSEVQIDNFDGSIKMNVDKTRSMGAALFWTGFHEFREFLFLHRFLKPEMVVVDVGANQGEYTLFAAKRVKSGNVLAFEPLPSILQVLHNNVRLNNFKNIEIFELGLSDRKGTLEIHEIEDAHEGLATVYPGERKTKSTFTIRLDTLDNIIQQNQIARVDFIKIDIEGGELKALLGAKEVIRKFRPVIMVEINHETYRSAGYSIADVDSFFSGLNYQAYSIGKRGELEKCIKLPSFRNIVFKSR